MNPFLDCPVYETEHFIIRKLKREDAELLETVTSLLSKGK